MVLLATLGFDLVLVSSGKNDKLGTYFQTPVYPASAPSSARLRLGSLTALRVAPLLWNV